MAAHTHTPRGPPAAARDDRGAHRGGNPADDARITAIGALGSMGLCRDLRWPSAHATHVERAHLRSIDPRGYMVADKTDGTRFLLVFTNDAVMLVDRCLRAHPARLRAAPGEAPKTPLARAVFDGEHVIARFNARLFLVYDTLRLDGRDTTALDLGTRLRRATDALEGLVLEFQGRALEVHVKAMAPARDIARYAREHVPSLPYATDGLVLTPIAEPVRPGTSSALLKWKPPGSITVDFDVREANDVPPGAPPVFVLSVVDPKGRLVEVGRERWASMDAMVASIALRNAGSAVILECRQRAGRWAPVRQRVDKDRPNSLFVYENSIKNIKEAISLEELIQAMEAA